MAVGGVVGDSWQTSIRVDPAPAYRHPPDLVLKVLEHCDQVLPLARPPVVFALDREGLGRTNGETRYDCDWEAPKDEHNRGIRHHFIVLFGKRIPPHPAVTRYLVAHEYGHVVEDVIAARLYKSDPPDAELIADYAKLRGLEQPGYYGPGTWHVSPGELFADDFRILVAGVEAEYWPHPGVPRPEECTAVQEWWAMRRTELEASKAA